MNVPFTNFKINFGRSPKQRMGTYPIGPMNLGATYNYASAKMPIKEKTLDTIAKHFSILNIEHFNSKEYEDIDDDLTWLLKHRPNSKQTPTEFYNVFFYNLFAYGNSVIIPNYKKGKINSLEIVDMSASYLAWVSNKSGTSRNLYIYNGTTQQDRAVSYEDIVHLRLNPNQIQNNEEMELFVNSIPEIIDENLSVILSELKDNFDVKGVLKTGGSIGLNDAVVAEEKRVERAERLVTQIRNKVLVLDATEDWQEKTGGFIKSTIEDITQLENKYYEFFGIPSGIAHNNYTFEEYSAFHKSTLEPKLKDFEEELQYKLITKNKTLSGEKLTVRIPMVSGMAFNDMTTFFDKMKYYGVLNNNEIRTYLGERPIVDGDIYTGNKNTANVDGTDPTSDTTKGGDKNENTTEKSANNF